MSWRSGASSEEASHEVLFQNFLMVGGSKETRLCTFRRVRPLASRTRTGAVYNTGSRVFLLLPAVTVYSFLPGFFLRDGCLHVLGLRFVVLHDVAASLALTVAAAAICFEPDVAASLVPAVAGAAICSERATLDKMVHVKIQRELMRLSLGTTLRFSKPKDQRLWYVQTGHYGQFDFVYVPVDFKHCQFRFCLRQLPQL